MAPLTVERITATKGTRPCSERDLADVAALHQRVFDHASGLSTEALATHLREVFFGNPWYDPEMPSLVCEDEGRIIGFLGVVPRRMLMNGRPIRVAVSSKLMVEPRSRWSPAGLHLIQRLLSGPQDLTISDLANDGSRKLWQAFGGTTSLLYSMSWTRLLSPTLFAMSRLGRKRAPALVKFFRPLSVLDTLVRCVAPFPPTVECPAVEEELTEGKLCRGLDELASARSLRPEYSDHSVKWLFEIASGRKRDGTLQKVLVSTPEGELAGWYVYHLKPGDMCEVLQVHARRNSIGLVLDRLFHHAWKRGAVAVTGRMEPKYIESLWSRRCFFGLQGNWFMAYSRRPDILEAINTGDAFLTRFEGEL